MHYDGVKLFKVSHKGYHDMSNVAQPPLPKNYVKETKKILRSLIKRERQGFYRRHYERISL